MRHLLVATLIALSACQCSEDPNDPAVIAEKVRIAGERAKKLALAVARMKTDTGRGPACSLALANLAMAEPPGACGALKMCAQAETGQGCWSGPYDDKTPHEDTWGHTFAVQYDPGKGSVTIHSDGPDEKPNTPDDINVTM